ncbi:hypothetical protein APHAL10511_005433 [Amanita phalloides]|nr:hypothetical protein APHAL10511_005433 [Amanita phalloides]
MPSESVPQETRAVVLKQAPPDRRPLYHDAVLTTKPIPDLKEGEILVKITAAAFNRREVWIRMGQYPKIVTGSVFGADGVVVASRDINDTLLNKRVFLTPSRGWFDDPDGPESVFGILGGGSLPPIGTFAEYVVVERNQIIPTPDHLTDLQIAAWPVGGVTAWRYGTFFDSITIYAQQSLMSRAAMVKGNVSAGHTVLITGIGGGVALLALQLCIAQGAHVYVTSGNEDNIRKAIDLGAKGGANYKDADWPSRIAALLLRDAKENGGKDVLDVVIDSAGGDIMAQTGKILKQGGSVVCYGMTASPKITFTMREVLKNQHLLGSTMGSHKDLLDATAFLTAHKIVPIVGHVIDGLEQAEEGFEMLRKGSHFAKIVIKIREPSLVQQPKL